MAHGASVDDNSAEQKSQEQTGETQETGESGGKPTLEFPSGSSDSSESVENPTCPDCGSNKIDTAEDTAKEMASAGYDESRVQQVAQLDWYCAGCYTVFDNSELEQ